MAAAEEQQQQGQHSPLAPPPSLPRTPGIEKEPEGIVPAVPHQRHQAALKVVALPVVLVGGGQAVQGQPQAGVLAVVVGQQLLREQT